MKTQFAIQSFLRNRQARNLKPKTIQWYQEQLRRFEQSYTELPTEPEPIEEFLANVNGVPETRHAYYRTLKAFYRFASRRHGFPNPIEQIAPPIVPKKVMPTLEPRQMMQLLNLAISPRDKALITLFIDSGARTSELAGLRRQDINENSIHVSGKTGEREIPISEETRRMLLTLVSADSENSFIFTGDKGRQLTRFGVYKVVRRIMTKAGIQGTKLGGHRLRHSFGKGYLVNGGDVRSLQQIMGHANITTTEKYTALNLSDTIEKHQRFTPLRAVHAAAQESFFDASAAVREAEEILTGKKAKETAATKVPSRDSKVGQMPPLPGLDEV